MDQKTMQAIIRVCDAALKTGGMAIYQDVKLVEVALQALTKESQEDGEKDLDNEPEK